MRIAVVTEDQTNISAHFGRAPFYVVFSAEEGQVKLLETRPKPHHGADHQHGGGQGHQHKHGDMLTPIQDCQVLIAGGMGTPAYEKLKGAGIEPILTNLKDIQAAAQSAAEGSLVHNPKRVHRPHH